MLDRQIALNRRLLLLAHALLGLCSAMVFVSGVNLGQFPYWNSIAVILLVAPPTLPYMISAIYSRRVVRCGRVRVLLFLVVLISGTLLTDLLFTGALGIKLSRTDLIPLFAMQGLAFVWAAELLLNVD